MLLRLTARRFAALVAPLVLLLPAAARAETVVTEDAPGDARAWTYDQEFQLVHAPDEASVDVIRTAAAFAQRRLSVAVHFRDLEVRPRHETRVRIWTPSGSFDVTAERLSARRVTVSVARQRGDAFGCRGLSATYGGRADTVALSVPARCIGSPQWVRLGVRVTASPAAGPDVQTATVYVADDAHRSGVSEVGIAKGPRIRRG